MSPDLPAGLRVAIERELNGVSRRDMAERTQVTSAAYRSGKGSAGVIRSEADALAYALARLPATYAACAAVFGEALAAAPDFVPRRLLDAGCGPGGGSWAALEAWPGVEAVAWFDESAPFLGLAGRLAADHPQLSIADASRGDLMGEGALPAADLVVASYALAEVPAERQAHVVGRLWTACEGVLALVEPGTPAGFARILAARHTLLDAGAAILAPCSHAAACPIIAPDWCHFSQRLPRSRDHQLAKRAAVAFEDEKYAYLLAARPSVVGQAAAARVLTHPRMGKPGIELKLCTPAGVERRVVGKRDKTAYAQARRLDWGDRA